MKSILPAAGCHRRAGSRWPQVVAPSSLWLGATAALARPQLLAREATGPRCRVGWCCVRGGPEAGVVSAFPHLTSALPGGHLARE